MRHDAPVASSFIRSGPRQELRAVAAALVAKSKERLAWMGAGGYLVVWLMIPIMTLLLTSIIYRQRPDLLQYTVVSISANALVFSCLFFGSEILDTERAGGTLRALFLAPCSRYSWLLGAQLVSLLEAFVIGTVTLAFGTIAFGVRFDPNILSLAVVMALFIILLWGLGMILGAVGLLLKQANQLSNLVFPIVALLGGVQYPVALLPDWLRIPARALPFGYGFEALAAAGLTNAPLSALLPQLIPLTGFAIALPVAGVVMFNRLEHIVRERGELDLY